MTQEQRVSRLEKWAKIIIALLIVVILIALYIILFSKHNSYNDTQLRQSIDSMKVHDKQMVIQVHQLEQIHSQDSVHLADIEDQLDNTETMINNINRKYAKERTILDNSSANTRLQYLSDHLPKVSH